MLLPRTFVVQLLCLLILCCGAPAGAVELCEQCVCTDDVTKVDCSNLDLASLEIPDNFNASVVMTLKLNKNRLSTVPTLSDFLNLQTLDLSGNDRISPSDFHGLDRLQGLDVSMNRGFILSNERMAAQAFENLPSLKTLRIKQDARPESGFDYTQLGPLNGTLEELFITGTPSFSNVFKSFTKLHTLSLGGSACLTPSLHSSSMESLSTLPLQRFSARNCKITQINAQFLRSYRTTLIKLDLSCNHLKDYLYQITSGVMYSQLSTLLIDHINKDPIPDNTYCPWMQFPQSYLAPLKTVPLEIFSIQANQLGAYSNLNLRDYLTGLIYFDASQNDFNNTAFHITQVYNGHVIDMSTKTIFHNKKMQPPALRYLGLRSLTTITPCGQTNDEYFDCNEESYLFLEDDYYWDFNNDPAIVDPLVLAEMIITFGDKVSDNWLLLFCLTDVQCIINEFKSISSDLRASGKYYPTDDAIDSTLRYLYDYTGGELSAIIDYPATHRYILANLTTLDLGHNRYSDSDTKRESMLCTDMKNYLNNLATLELTGSAFGFIPCRRISGYPYLETLQCNHCEVSGWFPDLFSGLPLKHLAFPAATSIGGNIRNDMNGTVFGSASELEILNISSLRDGIFYFNDANILKHNPKLKTLDLQNNKLNSWNITIISNHQLSMLDLRGNEINYISELFRMELTAQYNKTNLQVFLQGNDADCSHVDYVEWLLTSPAVADSFNLLCVNSQQPIKSIFDTTTLDASHSPPITAQPDRDVELTVIGCCAILTVLALVGIVFNYRYRFLYLYIRHFRLTKIIRDVEGNAPIMVYASHSSQFIDNIAAMVEELSTHGIRLVSRSIDIAPGHLTNVSIVNLLAESSKTVIFLTPEYEGDKESQFELSLIKDMKRHKIVVVMANMDAVGTGNLSYLPENLTQILVEDKQLSFPSGICSGVMGVEDGFVLTLASMLNG